MPSDRRTNGRRRTRNQTERRQLSSPMRKHIETDKAAKQTWTLLGNPFRENSRCVENLAKLTSVLNRLLLFLPDSCADIILDNLVRDEQVLHIGVLVGSHEQIDVAKLSGLVTQLLAQGGDGLWVLLVVAVRDAEDPVAIIVELLVDLLVDLGGCRDGRSAGQLAEKKGGDKELHGDGEGKKKTAVAVERQPLVRKCRTINASSRAAALYT